MHTETIRIPPGTAVVNVSDPYHVYRWCRRWGVTERQLRAAVRSVGGEARAVEAALKRARSAIPILAREIRLREDHAAGDD